MTLGKQSKCHFGYSCKSVFSYCGNLFMFSFPMS